MRTANGKRKAAIFALSFWGVLSLQADPLGMSGEISSKNMPAASLRQEKPAVYELNNRAELRKMADEPEVAAFMANALNDAGVASGVADPVLLKMMRDDAVASMPKPTEATETGLAAR